MFNKILDFAFEVPHTQALGDVEQGTSDPFNAKQHSTSKRSFLTLFL